MVVCRSVDLKNIFLRCDGWFAVTVGGHICIGGKILSSLNVGVVKLLRHLLTKNAGGAVKQQLLTPTRQEHISRSYCFVQIRKRMMQYCGVGF